MDGGGAPGHHELCGRKSTGGTPLPFFAKQNEQFCFRGRGLESRKTTPPDVAAHYGGAHKGATGEGSQILKNENQDVGYEPEAQSTD
jgi:hypothetical protein